MSHIDKYEDCKTLASIIIAIAGEVWAGFICVYIDSFILTFGAGLIVAFVGCFLINLFDKIYDKKIEKYEEENGKELSYESSQL